MHCESTGSANSLFFFFLFFVFWVCLVWFGLVWFGLGGRELSKCPTDSVVQSSLSSPDVNDLFSLQAAPQTTKDATASPNNDAFKNHDIPELSRNEEKGF